MWSKLVLLATLCFFCSFCGIKTQQDPPEKIFVDQQMAKCTKKIDKNIFLGAITEEVFFAEAVKNKDEVAAAEFTIYLNLYGIDDKGTQKMDLAKQFAVAPAMTNTYGDSVDIEIPVELQSLFGSATLTYKTLMADLVAEYNAFQQNAKSPRTLSVEKVTKIKALLYLTIFQRLKHKSWFDDTLKFVCKPYNRYIHPTPVGKCLEGTLSPYSHIIKPVLSAGAGIALGISIRKIYDAGFGSKCSICPSDIVNTDPSGNPIPPDIPLPGFMSRLHRILTEETAALVPIVLITFVIFGIGGWFAHLYLPEILGFDGNGKSDDNKKDGGGGGGSDSGDSSNSSRCNRRGSKRKKTRDRGRKSLSENVSKNRNRKSKRKKSKRRSR